MYRLAVNREFIANHYLIGGDWGEENEPHAHHYRIEVRLTSQTLDRHGYLIDIVAVQAALDKVIGQFKDATLNDQPEFTGLNPSIEHFSRILHGKLTSTFALPDDVKLSIKLWENTSCWASYDSD